MKYVVLTCLHVYMLNLFFPWYAGLQRSFAWEIWCSLPNLSPIKGKHWEVSLSFFIPWCYQRTCLIIIACWFLLCHYYHLFKIKTSLMVMRNRFFNLYEVDLGKLSNLCCYVTLTDSEIIVKKVMICNATFPFHVVSKLYAIESICQSYLCSAIKQSVKDSKENS